LRSLKRFARDGREVPRDEAAEDAAGLMATTRRAVRRYRPGRYAGPTLYLRAASQVARPLVWQTLAEDLEVVIVPGDRHGSFLKEENARNVAEVLESRLRGADGG
jgi:hypothetical protein